MLKIGDFSKLTQISIRMLRHYDEIGLLKPRTIDEFTGYRFYSIDQIPIVSKIKALKEMGFSLCEISDLLQSEIKPTQLITLLSNRKYAISKTIDLEKEKLLRVEAMIKIIKEEDKNMKYDISMKNIPAYKVVSVRGIIPAYNAVGMLWNELEIFARENNLRQMTPCCSIYHDIGYKEKDVDVEVTMYTEENFTQTDRVKLRELEEVPEMAIVMHRGPYEEISSAYHALGVWLSGNHYEICGPTRSIYHSGPYTEKDPANYLTEIQCPIRKCEI